jgi:hypothetical protein
MVWKDDIFELSKLVVNQSVLFCLSIVIASLIILTYIPPSETVLSNLLRIIAGAGGGGLLTITVINAGERKRANYAYRAIIICLCLLSRDIYENFKSGKTPFKSKDDSIILNLALGGNKDASHDIEHVRSQIHEQASSMSDGEFYDTPYKQKIIYHIKDLVNIYFRDAIYNTSDKTDLEQLYHGTYCGLQLIGSLEGWGKAPDDADLLKKDQLYLLALFLEICLPLYRSLLKKRGVPIIIQGDQNVSEPRHRIGDDQN